MTFRTLYDAHNIAVPLLLGSLLTIATFRVFGRLHLVWKALIVSGLLVLLTGLYGLSKFLILALAIAIILFGSFIGIWIVSLSLFAWLSVTHGWHPKLWQIFIMAGVLGPVSMLLDMLVTVSIPFLVKIIGISDENELVRFCSRTTKNL